MLEVKSLKERLSYQEVLTYVNKHKMVLPEFHKMKSYYDNHNAIMFKRQLDTSKPCNRISHAYADYIVNSITGYFMSANAVQYQFENEQMQKIYDDISKYNDESQHNTELAMDESIYGVSCELLYLDNDIQVRFKKIDPKEVIIITDMTVEENIIGAIRHFKVEVDTEEVEYVEYYTNDSIHYFYGDSEGKLLSQATVKEHFFGQVPINIYKNNADMCGDFMKIIPLLDAYDSIQSETADDFELFSNAIMLVQGAMLCDEQIKAIKDMRLLNFQEQGDAKYLYKDIPDTALENYKKRIVDDIHMFSQVPNMSDKEFGANLSGVALQYKLAGLEFKCSIKESFFKKGLLRRIELIGNILGLLNGGENIIKNTQISFTRNVINNDAEVIANALQLSSILSKESTLQLLNKFIINVDDEMQKLDVEREENMTMFNSYGSEEFNQTDDTEDEDVDDTDE